MDKVIRYYDSFDEWGRLDREPVEFLVNLHHIRMKLPSRGRILDIGAGPGKYSIALARLGYDVTLADLSPRLVELAKFKARESGLDSQFNGIHVADARDLSLFAEEQFDACLMLGPMYHLQTEEDRIKAVNELCRVTVKDGLVFVAFMSRIKLLLHHCCIPTAGSRTIRLKGFVILLKQVCLIIATRGGSLALIIMISIGSSHSWKLTASRV